MFRKWQRRKSLMDRVAQSCEYFLVAAVEHATSRTEWTLKGRGGRQYRARMIVDEWTDCPVVEIADPESGKIVQRFGIKLACWLM